jgi:serine/threonine protein kinase/tetratricopeptide (TPR) repeat protein
LSKTPSGSIPVDDRTMDGSDPDAHMERGDVPPAAAGTNPPTRSRGSSVLNVPGGLEAGVDFGPRFRIEKLLGAGGMGKVYKAFDKELSRTVALKTLLPELVSDHLLTQRFKQELLLASKISHRNILRIHDIGEVDGVKFITMAFIEGKDLNQLLKEELPFPLERSLKIARQLCEALDAAHSEGVVHRDFKPQNVLVGNNDQVYVSDFGLATSLETAKMGMTRTGAVMGTPRYMSPEQVEGKPVDSRSDLYALGLVLYEMVAGTTPFSGESTWQLMYQRVQVVPKDVKLVNPALPDYVARVIMHCLEKDASKRYQSAKEILADLDAGRSPSFTTTRTVQINLPVVEKRWLYAAGAGVIFLVGLFFAIPKTRHWVLGASTGTSVSGTAGLPSASQAKFVAVLPFRVLGDQSSLGYVADGLVEAMSAKLFQLKDVRLASSAAAAKTGPKAPLSEVGKELGVNLIVHGTVQGAGDNLRVTVNLENVAENRLVWSKEFAGVTGDLLTIEDHMYAQLVDALALKPSNDELGRASSHPTENIEAYDLYLRGRNAMGGQLKVGNVEAAIGYFDGAIKKDPSFALAYTGLADASLRMYREKKDTQWADKALSASQQAERLNDNLAEVHTALGGVYSATGKYAEAIVELRRALELAPNSDEGYRRLGDAYRASGRKEEAIQAYQKGVEVSPYYWFNWNALGTAYYRFGDNQKALEAFQRVTELEPGNAAAYRNIGAVYFQQNKWNECVPAFQKSLELEQHSATYSNLGTAYFYLKRYDDAIKMFEKALEMKPNYELAVGNLADAYRWSGRKQQAMATYDKAIALAYKDLQVNPRAADTMGSLALYYAKKGDSAHALEFIRHARSIEPENISLLYTQAVVYCLADRKPESLSVLDEALGKGYSLEEIKNDPELAELQKLPQFAELVKKFGK